MLCEGFMLRDKSQTPEQGLQSVKSHCVVISWHDRPGMQLCQSHESRQDAPLRAGER